MERLDKADLEYSKELDRFDKADLEHSKELDRFDFEEALLDFFRIIDDLKEDPLGMSEREYLDVLINYYSIKEERLIRIFEDLIRNSKLQ